ncbi:MAG TPA: ribosome maturation factor RimM [Actinomycetota bacterium]|nr:ribosome maturation factor RimM [Actinomycetota bacterium]
MGHVGKAVGLRGEVEVEVVSDDPERFRTGSVLLLGVDRQVTVRSSRRARGRHVVAFEEIGDREGAESLRGSDLSVPADRTRKLQPGEYWDHELVGCAVLLADGTEAGRVVDVLHMPAQDLLVVDSGGRERMVPLVADLVASVDTSSRTIVVNPIPGLLD